LQLRGHKIRAGPGESYPQAVLATIQALSDEVRKRLESEVDFLESLGTDGAPSAVIRQRWQIIFTNMGEPT
jgi:hypothetical protein